MLATSARLPPGFPPLSPSSVAGVDAHCGPAYPPCTTGRPAVFEWPKVAAPRTTWALGPIRSQSRRGGLQYNIKGGHSLQNREKHFKKFISNNPGPTSYGQSYCGTLDTLKRRILDSKERLQSDVCITTLKYKGIHFGNASGRKELPKKSGPGPGQYEVVKKKTLYYENINMKKDQQQDYCSNTPRFYEVIELQEEQKVEIQFFQHHLSKKLSFLQ